MAFSRLDPCMHTLDSANGAAPFPETKVFAPLASFCNTDG